jgi:hypothetical protein
MLVKVLLFIARMCVEDDPSLQQDLKNLSNSLLTGRYDERNRAAQA